MEMSKALEKTQDELPALVAPQSAARNEVAAIFSLIERVSADPNLPLERVEQAFAFYQRVQADQARRAYYAAFAAMQPELPLVEKRGRGHNDKKYARFEDVMQDIRPKLALHGFSISFRTSNKDGRVIVTGVLAHRDGHAEETTLDLPSDTSGSKNAVQAIGSSTSYGKRYITFSLLGIAARDEDDDGKAAGAGEAVSDKQAAELRKLVTETGGNIDGFLRIAQAETIPDIRAKDYEGLKKMLLAKKANGAKPKAESAP